MECRTGATGRQAVSYAQKLKVWGVINPFQDNPCVRKIVMVHSYSLYLVIS